MMKVIFLDLDGVLNGYGKMTDIVYSTAKKLHLLRLLKRHHDIFGIHTMKVRRLAKIVKKTGAKVVISSSWRSSWYYPYHEKDRSEKKLQDLFHKYNIEVIGITPKIAKGEYHSHRETEIRKWLSDYDGYIESFVVIDDEQFDLQGFIGKELVRTADTDYITGAWYENTGLKRKHVKQAISILNMKSN